MLAPSQPLVRQWRVPCFSFFVGKGGVGKTTVSSAYALYRAAKQPRSRILLLSTDPAHSLGDVLDTKLSNRAKRLRSRGKIWARQLDAARQINTFLSSEREDILAVLNRGSIFTRDELEPMLDTTLPGMAEVAALLAIHDLLESGFDEIVVDTAPMGHAIRLFQMPEHFARLLDLFEAASSRDVVLARHFGGRVQPEPALDRWSSLVERVKKALSAEVAKLLLVTTPEPFSLNEAARSAALFEESEPGTRISELVLNRVVEGEAGCLRCKRRSAESRVARRFLKKHFPDAELFTAQDPGAPILGVEALRMFGNHVFMGRKLQRTVVKSPARTKPIRLQPTSWPTLQTPLTLTVGKGGVGKTTVSAALAVNNRTQARNEAVSICSIDPAPSLDDVFAKKVGNQLQAVGSDQRLRAAELDAAAEFRRWADGMRTRIDDGFSGEHGGIHVDLSLDRKFLLALLDVVPPGVDEIFALFSILDLLKTGDRVVIDMAPTGHALEVLRTPARLLAWSRVLLKTLAAHRTLPLAQDAGVELATLSQNVREVAGILRDGKRCRVSIVTLPEPLPDYETRRLLTLLRDVDAPLRSVFINRVLTDVSSRCARCHRAAGWQAASIRNIRRQLRGLDIYAIREFDAPVAGMKSLKEFTHELWRLV